MSTARESLSCRALAEQHWLVSEPLTQDADYPMWKLDWGRGPEVARRIANWRKRLEGCTPSMLPVDHARPQRQRCASDTIPLTIERSVVQGLRRVAQTGGGTLFHALAAAHAWWLHLYADSGDVVGAPPDRRHANDVVALAGYGAIPVVLRCDVSGAEPFAELVRRIRRVVTEALDDVVPFDTLMAGLGVPRHPLHNPLFQTALLFQPPLTSAADDSSVQDAIGSAKFDIRIEIDERPDGDVAGAFVFSTELFDHETAREMAVHWCRLLDAVAAAPEIPMANHELVSPCERRRQLSWNLTTEHGISSQCVHEVISAQVERTPDAVAVQAGNTVLSYRQLDERAALIASRLLEVGAGPGTVVAVLLDRTPDLVAAIMGVLKSGAAFLPLDHRQPAARNMFSINDAGAKVVLTDRQLPAGGDPVTATVIIVDDLGSHAPRRDAVLTATSTDLAYVIYTSGSTGRPKGVLIEHRSVTNLMCTMFREFGVTASDTVLCVSSISFDVALGDIFCALACGARLVLATAAEATNPAALSGLIADSGATYMMATPTTWGALVGAGWRGDRRLTVASIGETLTDGLAEALLQRCGAVWNTYGPTEATVITSVARLAGGATVTVGTPLSNVRVYVTDARGRLQPVGVPGEITIGGIAVARGYLNRPEEHARRFGDDSFQVGGRLYRTGDRGRFLPDGRIQHLGRYDDQLKIRGFRVEPGEIESMLCQHPHVGCCAVVARSAANGEQQLVAYIVGKPGVPTDAEARAWLRRSLPEYMIPSKFVHLSALPTTASGKLDKAALPDPSPRGTGRIGQAPRNDMEKRVAALWAELLAMPVTDVNADLFDMGGHSLLAARLISEVHRTLGVAVSPESFLDSGRTVAKLAELLTSARPCKTEDVTSGPPLHFIFPDLSSAMSLRHFTAHWGAVQPVQALIPEQPGGRFDPSASIERLASQALSTIRSRQPDGPLALVGYSLGGLMAYEVARQAVDAGEQVEWLGILDELAPSMAQLMRAQLTLRWRLGRIRRLPARERWAKYGEVALRVLRSGVLWSPDGFDSRGATEIECSYQQCGHQVPMHLFVSEVTAADAQADALGWDEYHQGSLTVDRLAGNHVALLDLPEVEQLAGMMIESLRQGRRSLADRA